MSTLRFQHQTPPSGDPSPAAIIPPVLLADLTNPSLYLTDVASRHNLSLSQLSIYISRPAVSNHLASLHLLAIEHARLLASFHVGQAVRVLNEVLKCGIADRDAAEPASSPAPASAEPASPKSPALVVRASAIRARRLETLRRAATTVLQITRLNPAIFNYAGAHAELERQLPPEPAHSPLQSAPQPVCAPTPGPAFRAPAPEAPDLSTTAPITPESPGPESSTPTPWSPLDLLTSNDHTQDDPNLVTSGTHSSNEHWP